MSEMTVAGERPAVESHEGAENLRLRLYRGEHLEVAAEYLDGRMQYSRSDWRSAALIGLAMRHHFAALQRADQLSVQVVTEQIGDGLAITVTWPADQAIDEVEIALELVDEKGAITPLSRRFARELVAGQGFGRVFGRTLASDQTVVLRPIRSAATVTAVARPSHRLRFDARALAPAMRTCLPAGEVEVRSDFEFKPNQSPETRVVDVYGDALGREILEIISMKEHRERIRREQARRRRELQRRVLRIAALTALAAGILVGALFLAARFIPGLADRLPLLSQSPEAEQSLAVPQSPTHALIPSYTLTERRP